MKVSKLFKRLGALLTAVAVLASMGTVAFAVGGYTITIGDASITPTTVVDGEGVYTITVPYEINGEFGDKGLTALAYTNGTTDDELEVGDSFSEYQSDYKIAYVTQEVDPEVDEKGAGSISFNIDTTGEDAIEVGAGEKILVLIGGDGVENPGAVLLTTYWTASAEAALVSTADDSEFTGLESAITVDLDTTTFEAAVWEALNGYEVRVKDEKGNTAPVAEEAVTIKVVEATGDGITHKAIITVDKSKAPEGVYMNEDAVYEFTFAADVSWTADTLAVSDTDYVVYGSDLREAGKTVNQETITAALKDAVIAETITVSKRGTILEATVDADTKASAVTVAIKEGTLDGSADATDVAFVVRLAAETTLDGGAEVGATALTTEVTLDYVVTKPVSWDVTSAEFKYETGKTAFDVTYDAPDGSDKVAKAKEALVGEKIELKGANTGEVYEYEIIQEDIGENTVNDTVATISIAEDTYGDMAIVTDALEITINIAYVENTAGFNAEGDVALVKGANVVTNLDVTVNENTAEKIKAAIVTEGLNVKATLKRGTYTAEDVLIPVTADMVSVVAPTITEPATEGDYTATITVETTEDYTLAADIVVNLAGKVTVKSWEYGDVNKDGRVNNTDALWTFQAFKGKRTFTEDQKDLADVNNDGRVNNTDALWIFQAFKGKREL